MQLSKDVFVEEIKGAGGKGFAVWLTPKIIGPLFYVGAALAILSGFITMVQGADAAYGSGPLVLFGILQMILGPVLIRVTCEMVAVLFSINSSLGNKDGEKSAD